MKYLLVTMLAQVADDVPSLKAPEDWPEESYWVLDEFYDPQNVDQVLKSARIAMDRKITQDGMPGC